MKFIDEATAVVVSGKGGDGSRSFRREKHVPRGGPDGGDGGRGGDVDVVASRRSRSLLDYHDNRLHQAEPGNAGAGSRKTGRSGQRLELIVPPGTLVRDLETGELLGDLVADGDRVSAVRGGNGGFGNARLATSTRRAPDFAHGGQPAQTRTLHFELKLLADIALVGLPNAGKSSLIRRISASRAAVADYPFTTLIPNLGVVRHRGRVFTVADIPGLIEGAADGAGLGTRFLKHVERCEALVWVLDSLSDTEPAEALAVLREELGKHDASLLNRPSCVLLHKTDLLGSAAAAAVEALAQTLGEPVMGASSITGAGVEKFLDAMLPWLPAEREEAPEPEAWDPMERRG